METSIENPFSISSCDKDTAARSGILFTNHGQVHTPAFLPVGSQGSVKALTPQDLEDIGISIILSNTYHLYLRPGIDVIQKMGGLHKYMGWGKPILTDSGGYQIFSLSPLCKITDEGAMFRSHIDGSEHFITPEAAVDYQQRLGVDIIMTLDECVSYDSPEKKVKQALIRTGEWALRCKKKHTDISKWLFAIVQGGIYADLRRESALSLIDMDFPGYAIGGLSLGEIKESTWSMTELTCRLLPVDKPRYLMGVGSPEDILEGVSLGVDIFDSALPTRVARNGALYTSYGRKNILKKDHVLKDEPFDIECDCFTCRNFSAGYLHHLFKAGELLALRLATIHNLRFMSCLMNDIRRSIEEGTFLKFKRHFIEQYKTTDEVARISQKQKWLLTRQVTGEIEK